MARLPLQEPGSPADEIILWFGFHHFALLVCAIVSGRRAAVDSASHYPLLLDSKGWLGWETRNRKSRFSLYGALNTRRWVRFDASGEKWLVSKDSFYYPDTWWMRLLANTIYNPRFEAELRWTSAGQYTFAELQNQVCSVVDLDDDVLTQFAKAEEIKKAGHACQSFNELTGTLRKMKVLRK